MTRLLVGTCGGLLALLCLAACSGASEFGQKNGSEKRVDATQARCLALSMYWEAKAEGRAGMRAVGHVIMNRIADSRFPGSACAVVYEGGERKGCQFSWYCDGKSDRPRESSHWQLAQELAHLLLRGKLRDTTQGALFFHAKRLKVPWRVERTRTVVVGRHVFYK